jgi:RHS repeat-associated protein
MREDFPWSRTQMTRPNNVRSNYAYDNLSRLLSVLHQLSGSTIDGAIYTLDNAGNRTAKTDQRTAVATSYGYDSIYQLLSATQGATATENYTYDPVGNRLSDLATSGWSNNTSNELTSRPGLSYTFDYNGNTTSKTDSTGTTNYTWDFENRLTQVTLPGSGGTVAFKYDPFGRRIYKFSSAGTSIYAYDDDNPIEETNTSGTVVARYAQTESMDDPLAMLRSATTSYYEQDGLGTVTSLSNAAGALAQTYTLDSFGKTTASSGSLVNPFQFTGRELDSETALYYMRARYFDPATGRFLSEDPSGFNDGVNFYRYVRNNPTNNVDPTGLTTFKGFSSVEELLLRNAVNEALSKLRNSGSSNCKGGTGGCAGAEGPALANLLEQATFVFLPNLRDCGQTGPATRHGYRHVFGLGIAAFSPGQCCNLASTMVHELVHGLGYGPDDRPNEVEKKCFGCTPQ